MATWNKEELQARVRKINARRNETLILNEIETKFRKGCDWAIDGYTDPDFVYHYMDDAMNTLEVTLQGLAQFGIISWDNVENLLVGCNS